jgi:hypothetical protein
MSVKKAPYWVPKYSPRSWRILRARAGELPPVDTARVRSPRREQRRHDEAAFFRLGHDVARDAALFAQPADAPVGVLVAGGGDDQEAVVQIGGRKGPSFEADAGMFQDGGAFRAKRGEIQDQDLRGPAGGQGGDLASAYLARAYDQTFFPGEIDENGVVAHGSIP